MITKIKLKFMGRNQIKGASIEKIGEIEFETEREDFSNISEDILKIALKKMKEEEIEPKKVIVSFIGKYKNTYTFPKGMIKRPK